MPIRTLLFLFVLFVFSCKQDPAITASNKAIAETKADLSPDERYGELFEAVQLGEVFPDSKTFVDCTPKFVTDEILKKYKVAKSTPDFDLKSFVTDNFELPHQYATNFVADTSKSAEEHINSLWEVLTRKPDQSSNGTLLSLPNPYIVPGGRFGEIYYWDSYFTILGLQAAGKTEMIENMADNFSFLIENYGFIPNGNRTYFLGRSQPPFYSLIVKVLEEEKGADVLKKYLPFLEKEYAFWMKGAEALSSEQNAISRVVRLEDGSILNRYWDDKPEARPESYKEDVLLVKNIERPEADVYRDIRAACESGWDFSSRWFHDGHYLATVHTTDIIPVDLNALLYHLEVMLGKAYGQAGKEKESDQLKERSSLRKAALQKYCWDKKQGYFQDYDFIKRDFTGILSLAGVYPLYMEMATDAQANSCAKIIGEQFLKPGGVVSTLNETGQQWDAPNGWAPLQWMTIKGMRNYEQDALANSIKDRWVALNRKVYKNTGKMVEKYNVQDTTLLAGGGEYPVQDGFGWTNGILLKLLLEKKE